MSPRRGAPGQISSPESLRHAHGLRAEVDAIGVGSETVVVDDPQLTARGVSRLRPLTRVVFDRRLRMSPSARLLSTLDAGPVIIVTSSDSLVRHGSRARELQRAGAQIEPIEGDLGAALQRLGEREVVSLLLEGGPTLQKAAAAGGFIDAVHLYVAPTALGEAGVPWLAPDEIRVASLLDRRVTPCGPDVFMEGYVHGID